MDAKLRRELEAADAQARSLDDVLEAIAGELAEKVHRETGWDLECHVGWEEAGLGTLAIKPIRGGAGAACCRAAWEDYRVREIAPLFEDLFLHFEAPFGMVLEAEPLGPCGVCGRTKA